MEKSSKITLQQILWYFIIFSIIGLLIETLYGYFTMGFVESRKGLIWGPFCPVYGIGAVILILCLNKFKGNNVQLFLYGVVVGSISEYLMSYMLEAVYGSRFWQYIEYDLNGRICFTYSIFWGMLAILLIKLIKPAVDILIEKIKKKIIRTVEIGIIVFLVIDCICTVWAIVTYTNRVIDTYYQTENIRNLEEANFLKKGSYWIEDNLFSNEIMLKTFPNLRLMDHEGNEYFVRDVLKIIEQRGEK